MPTFNVGQDVQVAITGPFGEIDVPNDTSFTVDPVNSVVSVKKLDGSRASRVVFDCWRGSVTFAREDGTADSLAQSIQDSCLAGTPIPDSSIIYQVNNPDGSSNRYQLTKVTVDPKSLGKFDADAAVMQTIDFVAEQRSLA